MTIKKLLLPALLSVLATAGFAQNVVTTTQTGTSQTATANQSGANLTASISQTGTTSTNANNLAATTQTGTGHTATVNQNGSMFNQGSITQKNGPTGPGSNSSIVSQSNGSGERWPGAAVRLLTPRPTRETGLLFRKRAMAIVPASVRTTPVRRVTLAQQRSRVPTICR